MSDTSLVITSCGRPDLLAVTLASFAEHNTYPIAQVIITEDSGTPNTPDILALAAKIAPVLEIAPPHRVGQIASIDRAYAQLQTPYIFHCEDDWQFYRSEFIEHSRSVLDFDKRVCMVWIRDPSDRNGHPAKPRVYETPGHVSYQHMDVAYRRAWYGFSFNPGMRRLDHYRRVGPYQRHCPSVPGNAWRSEARVGMEYYRAGMLAATLQAGYVKHIGWGQTIDQ